MPALDDDPGARVTARRFYSAVGSARGDCGHYHRTVRAAWRCADRDGRRLRALPGGNSPHARAYSDRRVVAQFGTRTDAQIVEMTDVEIAECVEASVEARA